MPARSQAQLRLMRGIAAGTIAPKGGLTKKKAQEFIDSTPAPKKLPKRASKKSRRK